MRFIDDMANNTETNTLSRAFYYVTSIVVGLPLIYLLSVGPAVVIVVKAPKIRNQVRAIYTPMIWLHDHTSLKKPMDRYLGFWEQTARQI
jgi:hypothetical protein